MPGTSNKQAHVTMTYQWKREKNQTNKEERIGGQRQNTGTNAVHHAGGLRSSCLV